MVEPTRPAASPAAGPDPSAVADRAGLGRPADAGTSRALVRDLVGPGGGGDPTAPHAPRRRATPVHLLASTQPIAPAGSGGVTGAGSR